MNNKGISLVTIVVMIIIMIIIATVSILAGNRLIFETKVLKDNQETETIKEAMNRLKNDLSSSGSLTPKGESYIGRVSPAVGNGEVQAIGWYMLDEHSLNELGVKNQQGRFLVNYEYNEVLDMNDPIYYEKYNVITFMYEEKENMKNAKINGNISYEYPGLALDNKTDSNDGKIMYKNYNDARQTEVFGLGWYYVSKDDMPSQYAKNVNSDYIINYDMAKYVRVTSTFERVN